MAVSTGFSRARSLPLKQISSYSVLCTVNWYNTIMVWLNTSIKKIIRHNHQVAHNIKFKHVIFNRKWEFDLILSSKSVPFVNCKSFSKCLFLYMPFCHGALKLDLSTLLAIVLLWTSLLFIITGMYGKTYTRKEALPFEYIGFWLPGEAGGGLGHVQGVNQHTLCNITAT